ncbi:hypothetical protein HYR54_02780 [Candidatus Acetothermia bacterium]|nr:hypothetical protein [Candidatus Acetothermia bacterium]
MKILARFSLVGLLTLIGVLGVSQQQLPSEVTVSITVSMSGGYYGSSTSVSFSPNAVTVAQGGKVNWVNQSNNSVGLASPPAGFQTTIAPQRNFEFIFKSVGAYPVTAAAGSASAAMTVTVLAQAQQAEEVQEFSLIHSLQNLKIYPATLTVKKSVKVRLFNTAIDGSHPTVIISKDEAGQQAVFGVKAVDVEVGILTVIEFTPDTAGEFFITHKLHGHNIVAKLVVK